MTAGYRGFLNGTNGGFGNITYQNQVFELGTPFPWGLVPGGNFIYESWLPVTLQAGVGPSDPTALGGFFINATGLQWSSAKNAAPGSAGDLFGGWLGEHSFAV